MKKFLSLTSILLVAMMLFSIIPVSAETSNAWEAPEGVQKYYANDISGQEVPVIDGEIKEGEYGKLTVRMTDHITYANFYPDADYAVDDSREDQPASEAFDFYFAYDDNNIYIAYVDYGAKWEEGSITDEFLKSVCSGPMANYTARNNYMISTGFFLDDLTSYVAVAAGSPGFVGGAGSVQSAYYDMGAFASHLAPLEIASELCFKKFLKDDPSKIITVSNGVTGANPNSLEGQYTAVCEIKYSKQQLIGLLNDLYYYDFTELPNAMWFYFIGRSYVLKEDLSGTDSAATSYNRYFVNDIRDRQDEFSDYGVMAGSSWQTIPGLIIFGDESSELSKGKFESDEPASTEELTTEAPVTDAPATDTDAPYADTDVPANDAPATDKSGDDTKDSGCGGTVGIAGIALIASLGACTVFVAKKKEV